MAKYLEYVVEDVWNYPPDEIKSVLSWEGFMEKDGMLTKSAAGVKIVIEFKREKAPVFIYATISVENKRLLGKATREWGEIKDTLSKLQKIKGEAAEKKGARLKGVKPKETFEDYSKRIKKEEDAPKLVLNDYYKVSKKHYPDLMPYKKSDKIYVTRIKSLLNSKYFKMLCHIIHEAAVGNEVDYLKQAVNAFYHAVVKPSQKGFKL